MLVAMKQHDHCFERNLKKKMLESPQQNEHIFQKKFDHFIFVKEFEREWGQFSWVFNFSFDKFD